MFLFKKVKIKNFLSIGEAELELDNRGLVLIEGINDTNATFRSNGAGKSTLTDAITYALYDTTSYGLKADSIVNRQVGKNTSVILELEVDGIPYRIERYRKDKINKNKVKLFREDKDITSKSATDTNKAIQELFGIDYNTYINAIMYGQGDQVIFANATDKGKKEILENITNISVYKKAQDIAKSKVADKKLETDKILMSVQSAKQELERVDALEEQDRQNYAHTANLFKENEEKLAKLISDYEAQNIEGQVDALYNQKAQAEDIGFTDLDYSEPEEVVALKQTLEEWKQQAYEIESAIKQNNTSISKMCTEQRNLDTQTVCSYCGSPLDASHAEKEFNRLEAEIKELQEKTSSTEAMLNQQFKPLLKQKEQEIVDALADKEANNRAIQEENDHIRNEIAKMDREIANLENQVSKYTDARLNIEGMLQSLHQIPKPVARDEERKEINERLEQYQVELLATSTSQERYEEVVKMFSNTGIRSVVLDLVTPFLNEKANKYLATLSGSDIEINFTTQVENKDGSIADKFDVEILNSSGGSTYKSNSEGEKKRIDLAISFAIQDLVLSKAELQTNIALYDECFDGLDAIGCENVITLLKERQEKVGTIFVITHNSDLKSLFENVITIKKVDGISSIIS